MKCANCGAELQIDPQHEVKFCPYCGHQVEIQQEVPTTIAGAIHGIATSAIKEVGKQLEYNREHAEEIQEHQKKKERENLRQSLWILIVAVVLIGGIIGFCIFMGEREEAKKNNQSNNTGIVYELKEDDIYV